VESLEISARTVNEAIAKALTMLGKRRDEVEVSVLTEGSRGILGIGGEEARILVSPRLPEPELEPIPELEIEPGPELEPASARPSPEEVSRVATEIVQTLIDEMGLYADVDAEPASPDAEKSGFAARLNIRGEDLGILIGRRGDTLAALQFITNLILGKRLRRWAKVQIDVEGYRRRREGVLEGLALRMAARVQQTGQPMTLEAMPASERRVIHVTLNDHPAVITESHGEGDQRHVVISPRR
jgi:spoIIIJ-associated protein